MKLIYHTNSLCNPGGMERVLLNKVEWFRKNRPDWIIRIVTTDQHGLPTFYPLPDGVEMTDLGINYSDDNDEKPFRKIKGYLERRRLHKERLTGFLMQEKADIVISLYPTESSFIPDIQDGSKKVLELHFNKFFRLLYGRTGIIGLIDKWRVKKDEEIASRFDKFVVLTKEDYNIWRSFCHNVEVIPNAARPMGAGFSDCSAKRVIAVGRLDYQKAFDRLIHAWEIVKLDSRSDGWVLDIFGQGPWKEMLEWMIDRKGLQDSTRINPPTKNIAGEYVKSSMLVMSSHYEGLPMVMIEAMSAGLPVVTFDFKCGPRDLVDQERNGLIVEDDDITGLACAMLYLIEHEAERKSMGYVAREVRNTYSEEIVMEKWLRLFRKLCPDKVI